MSLLIDKITQRQQCRGRLIQLQLAMIPYLRVFLTESCLTKCTFTKYSNSPKKLIPIQTLSQLIQQKQSEQTPDFSQQTYEPSGLFLAVVKSIKKNMYLNKESQDRILSVLDKYKHNMSYVKLFVTLNLPIDQLFPRLNQFYRQVAVYYLQNETRFEKQDIYYILDNLERMVVQMRSEWTDEYWLVKDYYKEQKIAELLTPKVVEKVAEFDFSIFLKLARLCNTLGVRNPELGGHLLNVILSPSCRIKMRDIITILKYLSNLNAFPYEYFYQNKRRFLDTLQSYNKFSTKKAFQSIILLQVVLAQSPMHCQKIIKRLQDILLQAIPSFDHEDIANIWFLCSKAKFGIYSELIDKLLSKIEEFLPNMEERETCLIVRGFARFKRIGQYQDRCIAILKMLDIKVSPHRAYQKQIVKLMLNKLSNKQQLAVV